MTKGKSINKNNFSMTDHTTILETLILQIRDLLTKVKNNEFRRHGLTIRQFAVLDLVSIIGDGATPSEISIKLMRQPHSVSRLLMRMEKKGLVSRTKNQEVRTNLNIALTDKGRRLLEKARNTDTTRDIRSCLSDEEFQQLIDSLKKVRSTIITKLNKNRLFLP